MLRWVVALSAVLAMVAGTADVAAAATKKTTTASTTPPRPAFSTASGTVAAVSTDSMEVQNPTTGQVTVSWTPTTTFSQTATVPASQLVVGDCVTVLSSTTAKTGPIKATTVSLRASTNGSCSGGAGFGFGGGGAGGGAPAGAGGAGAFGGRGFARGSFPGGGTFPRNGAAARRFSGAAGRLASGQVLSLAGGTFVVKGFTVVPPKATSKSTKGSKSKPPALTRKTVETKVTFGSSTQFTTVQQASASNLSVGVCATALGPAGQTGAITATTISLRPAGPSGCTTTFGGFGGFGGLRGAGGTG
jgi:hypothetical protein